MSHTRLPTVSLLAWIGGAAALAALLSASFAPAAAGKPDRHPRIEVACDATTLVFQGPVGPSGPAYGASFVVQGYIYPAGTFASHGLNHGVLASGGPEFPDLVIGTWTCRGWFIGDGMDTVSGPFVATTQIYDLDDTMPGHDTLISDGTELIDVNVPFQRAVTGGSGKYRKAHGSVEQTAIGANASGLFNFTFEFDV